MRRGRLGYTFDIRQPVWRGAQRRPRIEPLARPKSDFKETPVRPNIGPTSTKSRPPIDPKLTPQRPPIARPSIGRLMTPDDPKGPLHCAMHGPQKSPESTPNGPHTDPKCTPKWAPRRTHIVPTSVRRSPRQSALPWQQFPNCRRENACASWVLWSARTATTARNSGMCFARRGRHSAAGDASGQRQAVRAKMRIFHISVYPCFAWAPGTRHWTQWELNIAQTRMTRRVHAMEKITCLTH